MKTLRSINRSPLCCSFFTLTIALCWFALSPPIQAQDCPSECGAGLNTGVGINALTNVNAAGGGINNTAVGFGALRDTTTGFYNTAVGTRALEQNTTGNFNMAIGTEALNQNNANFNLAIGFRVAFQNTTGNHLTGIGAAALRNNTTGTENTAIGADALRENTNGGRNTSIGNAALTALNGSSDNTAVGASALTSLTTGVENVAVGRNALLSLSSGANWNTGVGTQALLNATTGDHNTALGEEAGSSVTTGNNNIRIGAHAGSSEAGTVSNTICIGESGDTDGGQNTPNRCYIGQIFGVATGSGGTVPVLIDNDGQLGTLISSKRFKKDIQPMDQISDAILKLKPVTFHYKNKDKAYGTKGLEYGLIAEDVAEVNPDWVIYEDGKPLTVRYGEINVMVLNEFIKEHKKVEEQQASIADLKSTVALQRKEMQVLTAQLKEQAAQIQKVSAQVELNRQAPSTIANK